MRTNEKIKRMREEYLAASATTDDTGILLYEAIHSLPMPEQILLFLYSDLKSQRLLAEQLGVGRITVRVELNKIRNSIKKYIDEHRDVD